MKLLLVVCCLVAAVAAKQLFGTEQCARGPGVWCVNLRTASQCGAVKHCQQTVWNKPVVKTVPCDICKEVITIVENFLKDNGTEIEIEKYMNKLCELIPDPSLTSECKEILSEYYPIVMNIIMSELGNPSVTCCALHLCSSLQQHLGGLKKTQQLLSNEIPGIDISKLVSPFMANIPLLNPQGKLLEEPKTGDVCKDCVQLFSDLQDTVKANSSFTKMLIDNALKQCEQLGGGLCDTCKDLVNQYADLGFQMLIQLSAKQICSTGGLCSPQASTPMLELTPAKVVVPAAKLQPAKMTEKRPVEMTEKPVDLDPPCELCKLVIARFENLLEKNSSREQIEEALKKVCSVIPTKYCQECEQFIDDYTEMILKLLEEEITPKDICATLGLCSLRKHKMVKLTPEHIQSGGCCKVCEMIINYMDKIVSENRTQEKIRGALKRVCNFLSDTMADECRELVATYEPLFIALFLDAMDPEFVCEKLDLCHNDQKPLLGSEKCMWGPSYWCKDMETAGSCNAIEHCKRHVWN